MEKTPERKWDDAALATDAVTKKMIAEFLVGAICFQLAKQTFRYPAYVRGDRHTSLPLPANAASDFLEQHGIKFSKVDLVAKTYSKDILVATYKDLFATKSFRDAAAEEAKKAALEQQKNDKAAAAAAAAAEPEPVVAVKEEKIYFKKDVIKKGTGPVPQKGDNVSVKYRGTLTDGTVFDSNMEKKNQPALQFQVGIGKVIKGWDQALLTMNVGELAKLSIEAEGAYGKKGVPGKIPPNSVLIFEVELLNVS